MHLHTQDHTQEPSIGMIVPHFSCRMGVVVVCKWLYMFVWKKHDHSQGKSHRLHLASCFGGKGMVIYYMYGLVNINVHLKQLYPHPKALPEAFCTLFVSAQT